MDLLMSSQELVNGFPTAWDFELANGVSIAVHSDIELKQRAFIAAYLQKATIPGLEETGVDWTGALTDKINPRELDSQIRENMLTFTGETKFVPYYYVKNGRLQLSIQEASDGN